MDFKEAQLDMRQAYFAGGPGVLVSAFAWLTASIASYITSNLAALGVLFICGMGIHPLSIVISKLLGRTGSPAKENPLNKLALESTVILFIGLFLAFSIAHIKMDWVFPVILMIIGGRYLVFSSIYGRRFYWLLGIALAAAGAGLILVNAPFNIGAIVGGIIELVCAIGIINQERTSTAPATS